MKLSVIIPTYNRKNVLKHVLLSITKQTYIPHEVIIADDGSNDGTKDLVIEFKKSCNFNLFYKFQEKKGFRAAAARNMGIEVARGDKIAFVDHDVVLAPDALQMLSEVSENFFVSGVKYLVPLEFYEKNITDDVILNNFEIISKEKHGTIKATLSSLGSVCKKHLLQVSGFDEQFTSYGLEDTELIERLLDINLRHAPDCRCFGYHIEHDYQPRKVSRQIQDIYHHKRNHKSGNGSQVLC